MAARILFFESDPDFAESVRARFAGLGATVEVVNDGNLGLQKAAADRPDLILLTIELPQMNGFLVCKKLKKNPETQSIPVVILSSEATEEIFEQHRKLRTRAEDYLAKPVTPDELVSRVGAYVDLPEDVELHDALELGLDDVEMEDLGDDDAEVDDEIDAFAESAFDALVIGEEDEATTIAAMPEEILARLEEEKPKKKRKASAPPPRAPRRSERPPSARPPSVRPAVASAPPAPISVSPSESGGQGDAEKDAEIARLRRELESARSKGSGKPGGVSSREFLDLRESLNAKDREILDLRDQVSARDKQLIELRDNNLELERGRADFEDRIYSLEQENSQYAEQMRQTNAAREEAEARAEDLGNRLGESTDRVAKLESEVQKLQVDHSEALAAKSAEHAAAMEDLRTQLAEQAAADQAAALEAQSQKLSEEFQAERTAYGAQLQEQHNEELTAEVQKANDRHSQEMAILGRRMAETETRLAASEEQGQSLGAQNEALGLQVQELEGTISALQAQLAEANQTIEELTTTRARQTDEISTLQATERSLGARVAAMEGKIQGDEALLERARRALAIGLSLLEDQRNNGVPDREAS